MRLIFLFLLLSLVPASAEASPPSEGRWVLRAGGRPILLLELRRDNAGNGGWSGALLRPKHFETTNFAIFSKVEGPAGTEVVVDSSAHSDNLELTVKDSSSALTHLLWTPSEGGGRLKYVDYHFAVEMVRAGADERVPDVWDKGRTYTVIPDWPDNAEMAQIYEADQVARQNHAVIDWAKLDKEDAARRVHAKALLDAGELRSGNDFYFAAFIFQHGSTADDCLIAHTMAVIAAARGRPDATWIASASLDRYLQRIGQKQIYGTQYQTPKGQPASQEPYDRTLVSDALREALGVPPLAAQEERRKAYDAPR